MTGQVTLTKVTDNVDTASASQYNNLIDRFNSIDDFDGWTNITDTWTYASASTITIPAGGTSLYQKGMCIRFKQGGAYKYFNARVVASTLITVFVNTDYTVANSAITNIGYSFNQSPLGFPANFNFTTTPTYSGGTDPTSNTPSAARYSILDNGLAQVEIVSALVRGGGNRTSTIFSIPITPLNDINVCGCIDSITAASFKAPLCYASVASANIVVFETMANDGSYYINGTIWW